MVGQTVTFHRTALLDMVTRAKEELDAELAEHGLEWNGQYLVPRRFLEHDWPGDGGVDDPNSENFFRLSCVS